MQLPASFDQGLADLKVKKTLAEWQALGLRRADGSDLPRAAMSGSVVLPGGEGGPAYLVYDNYRTIMRWNRSFYFATSVGLLADRIGGGSGWRVRPMTRKPLLLASLTLCLLAFAGCSEVKLALHVVKKFNLETKEEEKKPPVRVVKPHYKLGSPYQVNHVWHYPSYDPNYDRTGVASWYGPAFHGRPTANGERFDMNGVTAAHPTLPLPSRVRVTNLENGRQLELRVNDRGPFVNGPDHRPLPPRRAASRLQTPGFDQGARPVPRPGSPRAASGAATGRPASRRRRRRTRCPAQAPLDEAVERNGGAAAGQADTRGGKRGPAQAQTPKRATASVTSRRLLVEAAVLNGRDDADRLGDQVRSLGAVAVEPERRNGRVVYAVRIGPVDTDDEAAFILAELNRAGFTGSHIVAAGYR